MRGTLLPHLLFSKTAAELISERADAGKPNMGLTTWKGTKVRRGDVTIAKNYLNVWEMEGLDRIVNMYLDYAEDQARRHRQIFMRDWRQKLDAFLQFNERQGQPGQAGRGTEVARGQDRQGPARGPARRQRRRI